MVGEDAGVTSHCVRSSPHNPSKQAYAENFRCHRVWPAPLRPKVVAPDAAVRLVTELKGTLHGDTDGQHHRACQERHRAAQAIVVSQCPSLALRISYERARGSPVDWAGLNAAHSSAGQMGRHIFLLWHKLLPPNTHAVFRWRAAG
jgi:hypothetical protein